jgi:hypothetical protein|tara:strand:+ start:46 stop:291 length:246 start_codon:yes stop_codon:yes gene_type:complete
MQLWWLVALMLLIILLLSGVDVFFGFVVFGLILLSFGAILSIGEKLEENKNTKNIGNILRKFTLYLFLTIWLVFALWMTIT